MYALSIRQPWAWLVVNGWKNVENREWRTWIRGRILIHAAKTMTRADYDACILFLSAMGMAVPVPAFDSPELQRGGIIGSTEILDCVRHHSSAWFTGPWGFVVADSRPRPFYAVRGMPGFWIVHGVAA